MSFSGALVQNAIYIAQEPPEWPIAAEDWERAAEARLEQTDHGLVPQGEGWFVLNARATHAGGRARVAAPSASSRAMPSSRSTRCI